MSNYINPAREQIGKAMRRGGAFDTVKFTLVCQQCGKHVTLTMRQAHKGARPACSKCGPTATFVALKNIRKDTDGQS